MWTAAPAAVLAALALLLIALLATTIIVGKREGYWKVTARLFGLGFTVEHHNEKLGPETPALAALSVTGGRLPRKTAKKIHASERQTRNQTVERS